MLSCNTRANSGDRRIAPAFWLPTLLQVQLQILTQGDKVERDRAGCLASSSGRIHICPHVSQMHIHRYIPRNTHICTKDGGENCFRREVKAGVGGTWLAPQPGWLHTCAVASSFVQFIAILTDAVEHSRQVFTVPEHAQVPKSTLVHICRDLISAYHVWSYALETSPLYTPTGLDRARLRLTPASSLVLGRVEAYITFTVVPASYIEALSIITEAHILHAFILVWESTGLRTNWVRTHIEWAGSALDLTIYSHPESQVRALGTQMLTLNRQVTKMADSEW